MDAHHESPPPARGLGRPFATLWAATSASNFGDGAWLVAAPLLATDLTDDPVLIAGLAVAQRLPWLLFGLVGGALADRLDRRRTMVMVALARAALVGTIGLATVIGLVTLPLLYAVFFLIAVGETLFDTSAAAVVPAVVPPEKRAVANARLAATVTATNQFAGPPLGGSLFSVSASLPFAVGASGLVVAAGLLATLRGTFHATRSARAEGGNLRHEIVEGVHWLWHHRVLRTTALVLALLNLTLVAQVAIMVLYAQEQLGLGGRGYGLLVTLYGAGGVLGGVVAGRVLRWTGQSAYLRLAIVIEGAVPLVLALTHRPMVAGAALAIFGLHATVWGGVLAALRQALTPDHLRGRVASVHAVIEYGTGAPGALLGGVLARHVGLTAPFWLGMWAALLLLPYAWPAFSTASIAAEHRAVDVAER